MPGHHGEIGPMTDPHASAHNELLRWHSMSPAELEREYSPSSAIGGDYQPFIDEYAVRSEASRVSCSALETLRYGEKPANLIDLVRGGDGAPAPLLIFIHGGYWQEGSRTGSLFGADYFARHGIAYAAIGYTLAPQATVAEIVVECRQALAHIAANAQSLGIDAQRIVLAGSSAGAHLAALCASNDSGSERASSRVTPLAGLVLLSGIFDLEPLVATYINDLPGMSVQDALDLSPMRRNPASMPAAIISWGEVETAEFKRQSRRFASHLQHAGVGVECFESPLRNHFDIVHNLADSDTRLGRAVLAMFEVPVR